MRILKSIRVSQINWLLVAIFALGLSLRIAGVSFGLPYLNQPDESVPVKIALRVLQTGDFNPGFIHLPSLLIYATALIYFLFFLFGLATGRFTALTDLAYPDVEASAVGKVIVPEEFLLARGMMAIVGTLAILTVYLIVRQLIASRGAALFAALLIAIEPASVRVSQINHPDAFVALFSLLAMYCALKILADPRGQNYFFAALFAGLAAGSNYVGAMVCVAILAAHLARFGWRGIRRREIYFAALIAAATFLITSPFALFDASQFIASGPLADAAHYSSGQAGAEGDTLRYYGELLWNALGGVLIIALVEILAHP